MVLSFAQAYKHGISWNFANQLIDYQIVVNYNLWAPLNVGPSFCLNNSIVSYV
jgi:hypothetical protein